VLGTEGALLWAIQEQEHSDHVNPWNDLLADVMAFLTDARSSIHRLHDIVHDAHAQESLSLVAGKLFEALSILDYFNVAEWMKSGSSTFIGYHIAPLFVPAARCLENFN
jgi:hypothetical protein